MTRQATVKRVIVKYGEVITLSYKGDPVYSEDTGWSDSTTSTTDISVVPYEYFPFKTNNQIMGNLSVGDVALIAPGDITGLTEEDSFIYRSKTYRLKSINPLPLEGEYLGYVLIANEEL